jgi:diguanylate cyclase (GGDEF)-like protein
MMSCLTFPKEKPVRRARRLACFLLCLMLTAVLAAAAASPAQEREKVVRVGWYESAFCTTDSLGRRSGYAYEYQMKIAAYTGWRYEYVEGSWSELLQMLIRGEIDLMSDVSYTPERAEIMLFPSLPMGAEEYYLFVADGNTDITATDYTTLNGKKVGVNAGSVQAGFYREWAENHRVESEVVEVTVGEDESLKMLAKGELDAYVTVDSFAAGMTNEAGRPTPISRIGASDYFFAVAKGRNDLLTDLDGALTRIQEENRYYSQELFDKHLVTRGANAFLTAAEKDWLDSHGTIRVGYQDGYLAFCARDPETGELTGALKDYLEDAADCVMNAHIDFEPKAYPTAASAMEAMKQGEVDCVFPANLSAGDGEDMGLFMTPPLMETDLFAVVRQNDRQLFNNREHVVVAVNEGNPNYDSTLKDDFPEWRTVYYPTTAECLRAVSKGVADCVLISSYRYNNIARQCERLNLTTVTTGKELEYCFAVAAGNPEMYSILAKVADLVPKAAVNTALSRYITEDAKTTLGDFIRDNVWIVIGVIGAILLAILILMVRSMRANRKAAQLIRATETDELTGLYNRDYFLQYAGQMRREHPETPMDAVVMNIDRFHSVNATNGRAFGDLVLRTLGNELQNVAKENGGIAGRFEADRFDLYCPHREDYQSLYDRLQGRLDELAPSAGIRLRMGVMPWQQGMEAVQMFDRARTACGMARENYKEHLIVFDKKMQERENYEQRLLNDLHRALNSYEFEVHYQPQFDIQSDPPKLVSAEALVRWNHPELGMISPNDFIPLFERSGKVGEVDRYVWAEAARQVARWRDVYGVTIPVSVNLSRVDVFDPALESALDRLLAYNDLGQGTIKLEVTESAYTGNADQVIRVVEGLRRKGYVVEMDDFGSGYSSLNMLSAMPVDVLKMDRAFIRRIGESEKDRHLVGLILGIARSLKIPVVAEGVETEEQLRLLRELGCPLVQGFYFAKPMPAAEFEEQVIQKMQETGKEDDGCAR